MPLCPKTHVQDCQPGEGRGFTVVSMAQSLACTQCSKYVCAEQITRQKEGTGRHSSSGQAHSGLTDQAVEFLVTMRRPTLFSSDPLARKAEAPVVSPPTGHCGLSGAVAGEPSWQGTWNNMLSC